MDFKLIDKILECKKDSYIKTMKKLAPEEDYLRDHFPGNPVMPGVLMLEAMVQSASWLLRISNDFNNSMIILKEASNVKYGKFISPGQVLTIEARMLLQEGRLARFQAKGFVDGAVVVRGNFTLYSFNLGEKNEEKSIFDAVIIKNLKAMLSELNHDVV